MEKLHRHCFRMNKRLDVQESWRKECKKEAENKGRSESHRRGMVANSTIHGNGKRDWE